jgi:hypothetical protein
MDAFHHNGWLGPKTLFSTQAFHFKKKSILGKENEEEELSRESGPSEHFLDKDVQKDQIHLIIPPLHSLFLECFSF